MLGGGSSIIAHDLAMVKHLCDRVAVMYEGKLIELGSAVDVYDQPLHPYTRALIDAVPIPDPVKERKKLRNNQGSLTLRLIIAGWRRITDTG